MNSLSAVHHLHQRQQDFTSAFDLQLLHDASLESRIDYLDCLLFGAFPFHATFLSCKDNDLIASSNQLLDHKAPDVTSWSHH